MARMSGPSDNQGTQSFESDFEAPQNRLWSERVASLLGFDHIADWMGKPTWGPYLLIATIYFIDVPILSTIRYLQTGYHPYLANPASGLIILLAVYAIWATRSLRNRYETTVSELISLDGQISGEAIGDDGAGLSVIGRTILRLGTSGVATDERSPLGTLVTPPLKVFAVLAAWGLFVGWILLNPSIQRIILVDEGLLIGGIKYGILIPIVYLTLAAEFFVSYLGIIVLLPLRIRQIGIVDFQDPLGFGGLRPVGDLIRRASTYYLLGLGGYVSGIGIGRLLAQAGYTPPIGAVTVAFIAGGITVGIVSFAYPLIVLHGHLKNAKHAKIDEIATEVERGGPPDDSNMFPETAVPASMDEGHEYVHLYIKMRKVENTREYPIDISHLQEFILAALVPFIAHVTVTYLLSSGGH